MTQTGAVRLLWLGDSALTLELPASDAVRPAALAAIIDADIKAGRLPGALEVLPALRSVTLYFDPLAADPDSWVEHLQALAAQPIAQTAQTKCWTVPVCFDDDFALDLGRLTRDRGIGRRDFIDRLVATPLQVRMLGFLPGFAYLGEVPELCRAPRLATPRTLVPAGSVAIAGAMGAVYPWDSPGGWNVIGRTPIRLFDPSWADRPSLFGPGDEIRWQAIDRADFDHWRDMR